MPLITPLPEAIDGRKWDIEFCPQGSGSMDPTSRTMVIPPFHDASSRFIRAHELGHAKITPRTAAHTICRKYAISMDALQACEDLRVHHYLGHAGITLTGSLQNEDVATLVKNIRDSIRRLAATLVSCLHTQDWHRLTAEVEKHLEAPIYNELLASIHMIDKRLCAGKGLHRRIGMRNCTAPAAKLFDALFTAHANGSVPSPDCTVPIHTMPIPKRAIPWGTLTIEHLPASLSRPTRCVTSTRTFSDEGSVLKAVHRLPVDGRVFCRTRKRKGGTVLVDVSGSMRFTQEDLHRIVSTAPAATVAMYSGRRRKGVLTVVAENGRMANDDGLAKANAHGSGNVVDGPALEWLAKQDQPRLWVSDGLVTGIYDNASADLGAEALLICRKAHIQQVPKAKMVAKLLAGRRKPTTASV